METEHVVHITCDNPACPGNDLDPSERAGWTFVTAEVYGQPTQQLVYCSTSCVSSASSDPEWIASDAPLPTAPPS